MVKLLQTNFQSCIVNNGYTSPWFDVTRSTHQGDPLAGYLFLICGETMAHLIRQNPEIHPLEIHGVKEILSQFADDTQLFEEECLTSLQATADTMNKVHMNVGLELNHEKTSIHMIGDCQQVPQITQNWSCTTKYPVILGIDTNPDSLQLFETIKKAQVTLDKWRIRSLTLSGRVLLINTLVASLFVYLFQVLNDPPSTFYTEYENMVKQFLWKGLREKIPLSVLQCANNKGGLGLCNIFYRLRALKNLLDI